LEAGEQVRVEVSTQVFGGEGLARLPDGRVILVPYALAGERLLVRVTEIGRGYARGEPLEVLRPSPLRHQPRCRHFGDCGGCHYQHLEYSRQLELKGEILREQLLRIGGLPEPAVAPAVASPDPWNYRNHLQFHVAPGGEPGFRAFRSHRVVPLAECHLPEEPLGALWPRLGPGGSSGGSPGHPPWPGVGRLVVRADSAGRRVVILEARPDACGHPPAALRREDLPPELREAGFWWHRPGRGRGGAGGALRRLWGEAKLEMLVLGERFLLSPLSFFQVNSRGAELLVQRVLEHCGAGPFGHALDLYCGAGLFSRFLAPRVDRLTAVELSPHACADFRVNTPEGARTRLVEGDAAVALAALRDAPDLIVADPPRAGLGPRIVQLVSRWRPCRLVYVSCDPATLARDAAALARRGWSLRRIVPVDMFPQTAHIESVSLWE